MPLKHTKMRGAAIAFGLVAAVAILPLFAAETNPAPAANATACIQPADANACMISGAETDDAATIRARAQAGQGPTAGFASDRRIKTEIKEVGQLENGLKIYAFKFIWEDKVRVGVIAQDLLERPDTKMAVLQLSNGLYGVDYAAIGLRMATEEQWLQSGVGALKADYKPQVRRSAKLDEPIKLFNRSAGY